MKMEIAKYDILVDTDCDICHGYYPMVYEFFYKGKQEGTNIISLERCRFCSDCLQNARKVFGDEFGTI